MLFRQLHDVADEEARRAVRERIIGANMCVADSIARRYRGRGEPEEDLRQVAYVGLSKAVNGYDDSYQKDFLTYAVPTISGELKRHFRDCCWVIRPPRRIQELQPRIASCSEGLRNQLNRPAESEEIADDLGIDAAEVREALSANGCFTPASLDAGVGDSDSTSLADLIGDADPDLVRREVHLLLAPLVREMPQRDRDIIALRFYHDWTQERIAKELSITQMQVSRLLSRIMSHLRERIDPHGAGKGLLAA